MTTVRFSAAPVEREGITDKPMPLPTLGGRLMRELTIAATPVASRLERVCRGFREARGIKLEQVRDAACRTGADKAAALAS